MQEKVIGPLEFRETPFLEITQEEWAELVAALEVATFEAQAYARSRNGPGRLVFVSAAAAARAIEGCTLDAVAGAFLTTVAQVAAVAAVLAFLGSEAAQGVSGAVIAADGGFSVTKEPGAKPPLPSAGGPG
jgi:hypothetical protein